MKFKSLTIISSILFLLNLFAGIPLVHAESLWDVGPGEKTLTALYKGVVNGVLEIQTETGIEKFITAPDFVMALSGKRTGKLVNPADYPKDIEIEVFFNSQDQVRAVKNKPLPLIETKGRLIPGYGHILSYSPDNQHYLLFDYIGGLSLYSQKKELYSSLSSEPTAAWNSTGTKFACTSGENLIIYDLSRLHKPEIIELPPLPDEVTRIIMGLEWSFDNTRLLYYCLEDLPDLGSDVFRVAVTDLTGNELASKTIINLGYVNWADDNSILFINYTDLDCSYGQICLWHSDTDNVENLLPWSQGIGREFSYNKEKQIIAYTFDEAIGQEIRYLRLSMDEVFQSTAYSPFPIRNMQWSKTGSLYYWDEYNELIWYVSDPLKDLVKPQAVAAGYLSRNSVQGGFLYFLSEPLEEPLPPYLFKN